MDLNANKNGKKPAKKKTAALLAIFLGGLGVHKFYLHRIAQGIIYIVFCFTGIPVLLGIIEGIVYLLLDEEKFNNKYNNANYVRPKWQKYAVCGTAAGVMIVISILIYQDGKVDRLIDAGKYEEAKALLDQGKGTSKTSHERYAKLYAAQGLYDEAVTELLNYFKYEDLLDIKSESIKLIDSYAAKASDGVKAQANEFSEKYIAAQAEKSKLEKAKADAEIARSNAQKAKEEADKSKEEADAAKKEADKSKTDAQKAKEEADKSKEEANAAKKEADKSKTDAQKAKDEADKSKEEANAAKKEADKSKTDAQKAKEEAEKSKEEANAAKKEADKSKADAADSPAQNNHSTNSRQTGYGNNGTANTPSKHAIENNAKYDFDYKAAMRYSDQMKGSYVVLEMKLGYEVGGSDGAEFTAFIYQDEPYADGISYDSDEKFIIKDMRKNKERSWVEDDDIRIWGKYAGIDTYYTTNRYTDKSDPVKRPVIEIYYDELIGEGATDSSNGAGTEEKMFAFVGTWYDAMGNCNMNIRLDDEFYYIISIDWMGTGGAAMHSRHWEFKGDYDASRDAVVYKNGISYSEDAGTMKKTQIYSDGSGFIYIQNGKLFWTDNREKGGITDADNFVFEKSN